MSKVLILARHAFKELVRKKDFYVLLLLFMGLAVFFYSETFFGVKGVSRYLKDVGFSFVLLFSMIISVSFSAKQIPQELECKTIYPLLAKPVSRTQFILGKFLGSLFISIITFTVFYSLYLVFIVSKGESAGLALILQSYILSCLLLVFLSSFAMLFSLFFTISANIAITFLLYFFIYWYNGMLRELLLVSSRKLSYVYNVLYYILPHFEFFDMRIRIVHLWDPLPLWVIASISIYTILYTAIIMRITIGVFKKRGL